VRRSASRTVGEPGEQRCGASCADLSARDAQRRRTRLAARHAYRVGVCGPACRRRQHWQQRDRQQRCRSAAVFIAVSGRSDRDNLACKQQVSSRRDLRRRYSAYRLFGDADNEDDYYEYDNDDGCVIDNFDIDNTIINGDNNKLDNRNYFSINRCRDIEYNTNNYIDFFNHDVIRNVSRFFHNNDNDNNNNHHHHRNNNNIDNG
jgi:hypothetical protein